MNKSYKLLALNFLFIFLSALTSFEVLSQSKLSMPYLFSDNMVLQRDVNASVWGKGVPGKTVKIQINQHEVVAPINENGRWMAKLPEQKAGGPYELSVSCDEDNLVFKNVMFGDVWLASGQSNMAMPFTWEVKNKEEEIAAANYPNLRLFQVPNFASEIPEEDLSSGQWLPCTPENVLPFSAVGYFFGRDIHLEKNIPIGIINSSWGGTKCEVWTSYEALKTHPDFRDRVINIEQNPESFRDLVAKNEEKRDLLRDIIQNSNNGAKEGAHLLKYNDSKWDTITNPQIWKNNALNRHVGFVWFRKTITIPQNMRNEELTLSLGKIHYFDKTYFNGVEIGNSEDPAKSRFYTIPKKLIKPGKNIIAVRVLSTFGIGGFKSPPEDFFIASKTDIENSKIQLGGIWKFNKELEPELPQVDRYHDKLSALYNAMINPLIPVDIKGIIWYQGGSNGRKAYQYRSLLPTMITDWRIRFEQGYLPFIIAQAANYGAKQREPVAQGISELREAQLLTALNTPNSAIVVTIDIGDPNNIHPGNKQDVGKRMAIAARKLAYNEDIVFSGPIFNKMEIDGSNIVLDFDHLGSGLIAKNSNNATLTGFTIAGNNKKFYWANARIVGDKVIVSSPDVPNPVSVRYAWESNPECNLYNKEGLPASPFRTDDWPGVTYGKK